MSSRNTRRRVLGLLGACVLALAGLAPAGPPLGAQPRAGLGLPAPGSYTLDHIQRVPFGIVLEGNRIPRMLSHYTAGAITLFTFFYSYCTDPNGCPLAWDAFEQVRAAILARPDLRGRVRLVFLSLDPVHDTPGVLKNFARRYEKNDAQAPWHFLTSYSYLFLNPVLRDMGEEISIDQEASASGGFVLNHLLKVFLIDKQGWVRENLFQPIARSRRNPWRHGNLVARSRQEGWPLDR